jgi:hypothetical protein
MHDVILERFESPDEVRAMPKGLLGAEHYAR